MPEPVLYIRGMLGGYPFNVSAGMAVDVNLLATVPREQLVKLRDSMEAYPGFLDRSNLSGIIEEVLPEISEPLQIAGLINYLNQTVSETSLDFVKAKFQEWIDSEENSSSSGDPIIAEFSSVESMLELLIHKYPSLLRQWKADRLATVVGQPLESIDLICEMRPVFDDAHTVVEGILPVTTLRVVVTDVNGMPIAIEASLTHDQVKKLSEYASEAEKKLTVLLDHLASSSQTVPSTLLSRDN